MPTPKKSEKATFKFDIESAVTMDCTYAGMVAPAHLPGLVQREPHLATCQIYLIAHRPRVYVDRETFVCSAESIGLTYHSDWGDGEPSTVSLTLPNVFRRVVTLTVEKGSTELQFYDSEENLVWGGSAGGFLAELLRDVDGNQRQEAPDIDGNLLDLKVAYVGQSMDPQGATQRRLQNHGTLQRVLADLAHESPHLEPWVILLEFGRATKMSMFGPWSTPTGWEKSLEHFQAVQEKPLDERQRIALAEAALIRYFQPRYNEKFVNTFPDADHGSYDSFFHSDYNAVGFEFDSMTTLSCRLWSDVAGASFFHGCLFPLHDESERRAFFDFRDGMDLSQVLIRPEDRPPRP